MSLVNDMLRDLEARRAGVERQLRAAGIPGMGLAPAEQGFADAG